MQHLPFDGPQPEMDADGIACQDRSDNLDSNPRLRRLHQFHSAYLSHDRDISVWLPTEYLAFPERRFPVLYLHDGQNLFDPRTSYVPGRTWCAHATADHLAREQHIEPVILVGINNTGLSRMLEYTPSKDWRHGGGQGPLYARLLVDELKPLIDSTLRTRPDPADTGLAGSSLGGLISLAIGLDYPQVFGKLGVLSPSVWRNGRDILNRLGPEPGRPGVMPPFRRHAALPLLQRTAHDGHRPQPRPGVGGRARVRSLLLRVGRDGDRA